MDKHSHTLMLLVVLCMLPLYCDLRSVNDRLNYDIMDGIEDDDVLQSKRRHSNDQEVATFKVAAEQRSPGQKPHQHDKKPIGKNVNLNIKPRKRRSIDETRDVKSRMREFESSKTFVRKLKAALVKFEETNTELNVNDIQGNVDKDSQRDEERNYETVNKVEEAVEEKWGVTLSTFTEEDKKPERPKIRIKIGDVVKEYDETEYCESIFLPKEPRDRETVLDKDENDIDDSEETQSKIKQEYDEGDYGELELKENLSEGGEGHAEETKRNVKREYSASLSKGKGWKKDNCDDKDGSIHKRKKSHSSEVEKNPFKVRSKNKISENKNERLVYLTNKSNDKKISRSIKHIDRNVHERRTTQH